MPYHFSPRDEIKKCFRALLEENPLASITIAQLCSELDIAKTTFYRQYSDKYDVVADLILGAFRPITEIGSPLYPQRTLREALQIVKSNLYNNQTVYKELFSYGGQNSIYDTLFCALAEHTRGLLADESLAEYYCTLSKGYAYASLGLTKNWLLEDLDFSDERYTDILLDLCPNPLRQLFSSRPASEPDDQPREQII